MDADAPTSSFPEPTSESSLQTAPPPPEAAAREAAPDTSGQRFPSFRVACLGLILTVAFVLMMVKQTVVMIAISDRLESLSGDGAESAVAEVGEAEPEDDGGDEEPVAEVAGAEPERTGPPPLSELLEQARQVLGKRQYQEARRLCYALLLRQAELSPGERRLVAEAWLLIARAHRHEAGQLERRTP